MPKLRNMSEIVSDLETAAIVYDGMSSALADFDQLQPALQNRDGITQMKKYAENCRRAISILNGESDVMTSQITDALEIVNNETNEELQQQ